MVAVSSDAGKFKLLDLTTLMEDPAAGFTLWVAIIAVPFQNLSMFGVDQLNAQRMFCCRNEGDARKAIIASSAALLITAFMLMVGAALFAYFHQAQVPATFESFKQTIASLPTQQQKDAYYPVWIVTELPPGLRALILAGIFAAAISSLDSILAALSQTTVSLLRGTDSSEQKGKLSNIQLARLLVLGWGIGLSLFALGINQIKEDINIVQLAFGMTSYTVGPMLGFFLAACFTPGANLRGLATGFALSFLLVLFIRTDIWNLFLILEWGTAEGIAGFTYLENNAGKLAPKVNSAWAWPVTVLLTWGCGYLMKNQTTKAD